MDREGGREEGRNRERSRVRSFDNKTLQFVDHFEKMFYLRSRDRASGQNIDNSQIQSMTLQLKRSLG